MSFNYFRSIYSIRHFIFHLVKWDMKYRFRRSKLGMFWTVLQPLFLVIIIAVVFGVAFKIPVRDYAPYILSGFLVWGPIYGAVVGNSFSFIKAEGYIKQFAHPMAIYPLRETLVGICTFIITLISLTVWIAVIKPENLPIAALSLPLSLALLFGLCFPVSIMSSHIHVRYRDYPYVMDLFMQFVWYLSPIMFLESMFSSSRALHNIFLYNPVTSILSLIRDPFLYGKFPSLFSYGYVLVLIVVFSVAAYLTNRYCEKDVIFYI